MAKTELWSQEGICPRGRSPGLTRVWKPREPGVQRGSRRVLRPGSSSPGRPVQCRLGQAEPRRTRGGEAPAPAPPTLAGPGPGGHPAHPDPAPSAKGGEHFESSGWARGWQTVCRRIQRPDPGQHWTNTRLISSKQSHQRWLKTSPDSFPLISRRTPVALQLLCKAILSIYLLSAWSWMEGAEVPRLSGALLWAVSCWRHPSPGTTSQFLRPVRTALLSQREQVLKRLRELPGQFPSVAHQPVRCEAAGGCPGERGWPGWWMP